MCLRSFCFVHFFCSVCFVVLLATQAAFAADERITSYEVDITILKSSALRIEERITVRAAGNRIKRGIYRDFPLHYRDRHDNRVSVGFDVLDVKRDGRQEDYHLKKRDNGIRIYIGNKSRRLPPGVYTYAIEYRTTWQLGFFESHDELYFNAIPHGFEFPIDKAHVRVFLPSAEIDWTKVRYSAYTGRQGSRGQNYRAWRSGGAVAFQSTSGFAPRSGMTIVVEFPKGLVREPGLFDYMTRFLSDNADTLTGLIGLLLLCGFYFVTWQRVGRDPAAGTIIPIFSPPENLTAAEMHYLQERGCDNNTVTAALIDLAIKGYLHIDDRGDKIELKCRDSREEEIGKAEQRLYEELFPGYRDCIELDNSNHSTFQSVKSALEGELKRAHLGQHFHLNRSFLFPGVLISIGTIVLMGIVAPFGFDDLFRPVNWLVYVGMIVAHFLFAYLLEAPTRRGRKLLDQIEGFKMYLGTAESETLEKMGAPRDDLNIFEKFLPFAIALGVEQAWSDRFAGLIAQAMVAGGAASVFTHDWHSGSGYSDPGRVASSIGSSLSSQIASASTPPGSSSGGGGGGFSGGGGGGGGGGGW